MKQSTVHCRQFTAYGRLTYVGDQLRRARRSTAWWIMVIFLFAMACGSPMRDNQQNVVIATKIFEAFNHHAWDSMAGYYAESAQFLDPSFGTEYVSKMRKETAAKYREMETMFPDIHDQIVGMYPSGDKVTVEFVSTGTMGDTASFKLPIVTVLTFKDGFVVKDATYYDL